MQAVALARFPKPRKSMAKGRQISAPSIGPDFPGSDLPGCVGAPRLADEATGTWKDRDTSLKAENAGNDHEVPVNSVHPLVARVAVAPEGKPVTVR
jgi:hypothetical protein